VAAVEVADKKRIAKSAYCIRIEKHPFVFVVGNWG